MKQVTQAEYDAVVDHADTVSREAWKKLSGYDATATLIVIGTLIASLEGELDWSREEIIAEVCEYADCCTEHIQ